MATSWAEVRIWCEQHSVSVPDEWPLDGADSNLDGDGPDEFFAFITEHVRERDEENARRREVRAAAPAIDVHPDHAVDVEFLKKEAESDPRLAALLRVLRL